VVDVFKGFVSGNLAYLTAWFVPSFTGVGAFAILVLPHVLALAPFAWLASQSATITVALMVGAGILLGVVLATSSTPLYRRLEGYSWLPFHRYLSSRMKDRQKQYQNAYQIASKRDVKGYRLSLLLEGVQRFPSDIDEVLPTRMGNAIRAFETYAWHQYQMDSQSLWEPLWAVTPQQLRDEYDQARSAVDFCVAMMAVLVLFATTTVVSALTLWFVANQANVPLLTVGLVAPLILARFFYGLAVGACYSWGSSVKGIVEIGRSPLAGALGLTLPPTLNDERVMWKAVSRFVRESRRPGGEPYDWTGADNFDSFRANPQSTSPSSQPRAI
jgi:hypothetical protein